MKVAAINGGALVVALALGVWLTGFEGRLASESPRASADALVDATGARVPVRAYERIVSGSTISDQVLLEIVARERVIAITGHTRRTSPTPWRYAGIPTLEVAHDVESVLRLRPDLVIVSNVMEPRRITRLREAGVTVFDLGPMTGLATLLDDARTLGSLLGVPERGGALADRLARRYANIADDRHDAAAMYLGIVGGQIYGGAAGTNFHDVLVGAGIRDVASERGLEGWPALSSEQILAIDPPWIVTNAGRERRLCRHPGLDALRACRENRIVGIDEGLLGDPGLGLIEAAEILHARIYEAPR